LNQTVLVDEVELLNRQVPHATMPGVHVRGSPKRVAVDHIGMPCLFGAEICTVFSEKSEHTMTLNKGNLWRIWLRLEPTVTLLKVYRTAKLQEQRN